MKNRRNKRSVKTKTKKGNCKFSNSRKKNMIYPAKSKALIKKPHEEVKNYDFMKFIITFQRCAKLLTFFFQRKKRKNSVKI